jgi:Zn2+/Cd2+-exporting ATPase
MTLSALGYVQPAAAAAMHTIGSLMVVFNSARLVRKGEELEHYQPEQVGPKAGRPVPPTATPTLAPKVA